MKWSLCAGLFYCAVASLGCGSSASGKGLTGSYTVMITAMGKSDPDIMTVTLGSAGALVLMFEAGITTDVGAANADGLHGALQDSSHMTLATQPAHIDHSTGQLDGSLSGMGTLKGDGTCDITISFNPMNAPAGVTGPLSYEITGSKM